MHQLLDQHRINDQLAADRESRLIRGKEYDRFGDFYRITEAADGNLTEDGARS
jgi:hypothetical protein